MRVPGGAEGRRSGPPTCPEQRSIDLQRALSATVSEVVELLGDDGHERVRDEEDIRRIVAGDPDAAVSAVEVRLG